MDVCVFFDKGDLHVGIFPAFFREYLYSNVVVFVGGPAIAVVAVNLTIENDRGSAGRFRLAGHFQFFLRDRLPFVASSDRPRALR